jgi:hypothetical protein
MYISETSSINVPFTFTCARETADEVALVDSGATENFMGERMVKRLGIGRRPMKMPRRVFNVDGSENQHGTLTHYCLLRVSKGDKEVLLKFYVTSLGGDCAIFGFPWLQAFNPTIDWDQKLVRGPPVMVETSLLKLAKQKEIHHIIAAAQQSGEWEPGDEIITSIAPLPTHAAQEWAIAANKAKPKVTPILPKRYQRHAKIFSEDGVQ